MVCMTCGRNAETTAQFCSSCGHPLRVYGAPVPPLSRLHRPRESRMIAGVCAALALQYGWDLTVVRLVLVIATLFTGVPVIAYLIAWVVIPNAPYALPAPSAGAAAGPIGVSNASYRTSPAPLDERAEPGTGSIVS